MGASNQDTVGVEPMLTSAIRGWQELGLEIGETALVSGEGPLARMFCLAALWHGACPVILLAPVDPEIPRVRTWTIPSDDPEPSLEKLAGRLAGVPAVAAVDLSGLAVVADSLFEVLPVYARLMLAGSAGELLTIDYYNNIHRKGVTVLARRIGSESHPVAESEPDADESPCSPGLSGACEGGDGGCPGVMTPVGATQEGARPIRVCMVSFYYEPNFSGSAIQAGNLSRYLQRRNVEPFVVSAMLDSNIRQETLNGVPVHRIPVSRNRNLQIPSFWIGLMWFLWRHRRSWDVVHAHGTLQHGSAAVIARILGKGSVLKVAMHRSDIAFSGQGRVWGRINRFYVRRFHRYIATSRQIQDEFAEEGMSRKRVLLLPNGVDMERFRPSNSEGEKLELKGRLGLPMVPVALFAGIVLARKNVDFVIRAFLKVRSSGLPGHLVIVGPGEGDGGELGEAYFDRLQEMIRSAGMEQDVTFTGRRSNVEEYIRAADMFLFAPRKEGMPNVLLEAMSGGLPCVVSRISGIEDVIDSGVNGFIFDLESESEYTEAVTDLFRNPALRSEIGDRARKKIRSRYSLDRVADEYVRIYRELIRDSRSK